MVDFRKGEFMSGAFQTTIKTECALGGVGLHSGAAVTARLLPAPAGAGVVFRRVDLIASAAGGQHDRVRQTTIRAHAENVTTTRLGTTLENEHGASISTVEHLMAALSGCGVDNVLVEVDGPELPILDGSSAPFVEMIEAAGIRTLKTVRRSIVLTDTVRVEDGDRFIEIAPFDGFAVDVEIDFADAAIGRQGASFENAAGAFGADLADARTFCMRSDIDAMRNAGLALGGSLDNAIVVEDGAVLNEGGLRREDEFARHKALDLIGDLYLAGAPLKGRVTAFKPGHDLNVKLAQAVLAATDAWEWAEERRDAPQTVDAREAALV
ncbi:MAG: UDP-3-O-acyl-N-acetylglucosamine deacetylase [Pseudomonadota bacterium]